jgi:nucleotide-binding universal stress UspA family protein
MGRKVLVAFDESENAMRAVDFVAKSFTPDHEITLFHVVLDTAAICELNSPELTPLFIKHQVDFCTLEDKKKELVSEGMQKAKDLLLKAGFQEKSVTLKVEGKKKGIARDIVAEAQSGYDMVVLGRRGLSGIQEFFLGSVSQKVVHGSKKLSVILVN